MSKEQRHERKKIERTRRCRSSSHSESARPRRTSRSVVRDGATALAAAAAIAGGTQAYATPVRFENPPGPEHFIWAGKNLDVTDPAAEQRVVPNLPPTQPSSFYQFVGSYGSVFWRDYLYQSPILGSAALQVEAYYGYAYLVGVASGDTIPSGSLWHYVGIAGYPDFDNVRSLLPEGVATYLGVRFLEPGVGTHYGWIGVERTGFELDAFAWGYETDPGVPIAAGVPEPGTLAMLAFGAGAVSLRRRRSYSN